VAEKVQPENESILRVDALKSIQPSQYELWKYFEDRADRLGERLWSVGAWLMTVIAATLTLPFAANFIETSTAFFPVRVAGRLPLTMIAAFGMLFCIYSYAALRDVREHIESNWRKAGYVLNGTWQTSWGGRKSHGWNVLLTVGSLGFASFAALFLLAIVNAA